MTTQVALHKRVTIHIGVILIPVEKWVSHPKFQGVERFVNGYAIVKQNGKWGIMGIDGTFTAPPAFDKLRSLLEEEPEEEL